MFKLNFSLKLHINFLKNFYFNCFINYKNIVLTKLEIYTYFFIIKKVYNFEIITNILIDNVI